MIVLSSVILVAAGLLGAGPLWGNPPNPPLSDDFSSMMKWLSQETVQGISFNVGTTFDPPLELKPWGAQAEFTFGVGAVPLDRTRFPAMQVPALSDMQMESYFPSSVPFPDVTAHYRVGFPGRFDVALRFTNVTVPRWKITSGMEVKGQANNYGVQIRRFFGDGDYSPLVSIGLHANYLKGKFTYYCRYENVNLDDMLEPVNIDNTGSLEWHLQSYGIKAVLSQRYGKWLPFLGAGYSLGTGALRATLDSDFDVDAWWVEDSIVGSEDSKPKEATARLLGGVQFCRESGWDYFLTSEILIAGVGERKSYNIHVGMVVPLRFGSGSRNLAKKPAAATDRNADINGVEGQHLIFIQ